MIYFVSDQHFGISSREDSKKREQSFIKWLTVAQQDAEAFYFIGDLFDFWFEYKSVVQKGYVRLFGKLAEIVDAGIPVYYFRGNHDIWAFDYLETEIGMKIHDKPLIVNIKGKTFYIAHGDGLGKGDNGYKFLKKVFQCRFNQWWFRRIHPDFGTRIGLYWAEKSRIASQKKTMRYHKENAMSLIESTMKQRLANYCNQVLKTTHVDFFVFGHYHQPIEFQLNSETKIFTIGDWLNYFSHGVFDGEKFTLKILSKENQ